MAIFTLRQRLWAPLAISWLCLLGVSFIDAWELKNVRTSERQNSLQHVSETVLSVIKDYGQLVNEGKMPLSEAQTEAKSRVRAIRYGSSG